MLTEITTETAPSDIAAPLGVTDDQAAEILRYIHGHEDPYSHEAAGRDPHDMAALRVIDAVLRTGGVFGWANPAGAGHVAYCETGSACVAIVDGAYTSWYVADLERLEAAFPDGGW